MMIDPILWQPLRFAEPVASTSSSEAGPWLVPSSTLLNVTPPAHATPAVACVTAPVHHSNKGKDWALPSSEVDVHANPWYPSQLPPVFTQCYAEQEHQLKAKEQHAAEQHDLEHCMKNTVEAYGWSQVCLLEYGAYY